MATTNPSSLSFRLKLPPGPLGVTFSGKTQVWIRTIKPSSPLHGVIQPGYIVQSLTLENGTKLTSFTPTTLAAALTENKASSERALALVSPSRIPPNAPPGGRWVTFITPGAIDANGWGFLTMQMLGQRAAYTQDVLYEAPNGTYYQANGPRRARPKGPLREVHPTMIPKCPNRKLK